jgi:hypothetical protein
MIASLFLTFFASSRSENDLPQAELLSYDYSYNTNFGIGYQTNTELERSDIKNNQWNDEDKWIKLWLRIHILTPQNGEWNHPQQYCQAINVTNVKVSSTCLQDIHYRLTLVTIPISNHMVILCHTSAQSSVGNVNCNVLLARWKHLSELLTSLLDEFHPTRHLAHFLC